MEIPTCRRPTLSHQLAMMDSSNLRDLLRVREAEDEIHRHGNSRLGGTVTLATVLAFEKRDVSSPSSSSAAVPSRSLLDIIRDEDDPRRLLDRHEQNDGGSHRICWKSFRERLRLHRATAAWSSAAIQSPTVISISNNTGSDLERQSLDPPAVRPQLDDSTGGSARRQPETQEQTRVSLMTLLEQTDRMGNAGHESSTIAAAMIGMVEEEEAMPEERKMTAAGLATDTVDDIGGVDKGMHICCVCMVRHKGSAFIPCGHTFCRLCSRELWVSRGNCPLCNAFILEILDIF